MGGGIHLKGRGRGFTLVELFVVVGVIGLMGAIVIPPWRGYRARLNANAAAQALRADLVRAQAYAISQEQPCTLVLDSSTQYSLYYLQPASITSGTPPVKRISVAGDGLVLNPNTGRLVFASRGWVDAGLTTIASSTLSAAAGGYTVYPITVQAPGVARSSDGVGNAYNVQVLANGKVRVQ